MSRGTGWRWCIEPTRGEAKGLAGLERYEVWRSSDGHGHIASALLAHAAPIVAREVVTGSREGGASGLIALAVPGRRRLL